MSALTQDDLLIVVDNVVDESYLQPIKDFGPGYELYQASAKVGERCSTAVDRFSQDYYILSSRGGVLATVPVTFFRETSDAGAGSMLAGSIVRASRGGQTFRTLTDAVFGPTDLTATTTAIATGFGYEWNILGPFVDRDGVSWPGQLDVIDIPLQDPVFFDPSIQVRNDADADGLGRPATLDVLGGERSLARQTGELDESYRIRIRQLPDTVAPNAIRRQLANYFRRAPGLFWRAIETWQHEYQECYDAPDLPPQIGEPYNSNLFVYDDPRPPSPFQNRYLSEIDYQGAFIVEVGLPPVIHDFSLAYDDPANDIAGVSSGLGVHAFSAFDLPDVMIPPALAPAYDGFDDGLSDLITNLYKLLDDIKAGGVYVAIVIQEQ